MKKVLLLAASAGIVLSGCVKNEPADTFGTSDAKITFEAPAVGATTRAIPGEIDNSAAYPEKETFNVWGWYHEGVYTNFAALTNYMTQADGKPIMVAKEGNTWAPATDYFWPKTGKLTFAAYSPADAAGTFTHTAQGLQIEGFTVPAVGAQYDLMYSDRAYNRTSSDKNYTGSQTTNPYDGVDIVFHHALSSIVFKVGTAEDYSTGADIDFKIKSITIKNVYGAGDFNETLTDGTTTRTPAWTATGNADAQYVAFTGDFAVPEDGTTYTEPTLPDAEPTDLILLPQSFEGNDAAVVEIAYTYKTAASAEIAATETFILKNSTNAKTWEPNKRYTYRILFGLEKITFAPIVENWEDVTVEPGINL
uniref:fimbrillin family protein n=1 Tax=Alistipes megaguti TaxID=2364787 RepID=UPI0013CEF999|nr:fimbrillin family protein [Alistipes megaguti]